ncbi:MAG: hypothetical protein JWR19_990 [Pedosphaera sp.]|nr:hypothetical protein [Pedosphaera sp.]
MSLAIEAFTENVRQFCEWAESDRHDVLTARQLLLALMQGIPYLIIPDAGHENDVSYPRRSHEEWMSDHKRFADFPFQYYQGMFSPCDLGEEEPVMGDVHDDLADIYGDLWHGSQALNRDDGVYAVRYWREFYFHHWGHHASSAVYAIDEYYRKAEEK